MYHITPGGIAVANDTQGPVDCEGSSLEIGDLVVYNLSGGLARGNILKIVKRKAYIRQHEHFGGVSINRQFSIYIGDTQHPSIVTNTDGIYRLRDYDRGGPPR